MNLFTIGFTKSSAEHFFDRLRQASVRRLVDVRLNNVSQLAGFAKRDDLRFFLKEICAADYAHETILAPTEEMLGAYRKKGSTWNEYERDFLQLMSDRKIEERLPRDLLDGACLLCSEDKPHRCHRRLVAEYLRGKWGNVTIHHL
jgi:uncharacterized protein (DUF488 family)